MKHDVIFCAANNNCIRDDLDSATARLEYDPVSLYIAMKNDITLVRSGPRKYSSIINVRFRLDYHVLVVAKP